MASLIVFKCSVFCKGLIKLGEHTTMRNWNNQMFLGSMPGIHEPFASWLSSMKEQDIEVLVVLTPLEDVEEVSPEYYSWLCSLVPTFQDDPKTTKPGRYEVQKPDVTNPKLIWYVPIRDFGAPNPQIMPTFLEAVKFVADSKDTQKTFVHCEAGIGRTGTFACSVLRALGYSGSQALAEIRAVGSSPETPQQKNLVETNPL